MLHLAICVSNLPGETPGDCTLYFAWKSVNVENGVLNFAPVPGPSFSAPSAELLRTVRRAVRRAIGPVS